MDEFLEKIYEITANSQSKPELKAPEVKLETEKITLNLDDLTLRRSVKSDKDAIKNIISRYKTHKYGPDVHRYNRDWVENAYTVGLLDDKIVALVDLRLSDIAIGFELGECYVDFDYSIKEGFGFQFVKKALDMFSEENKGQHIFYLARFRDESVENAYTNEGGTFVEGYLKKLGFRLLLPQMYRHFNAFTDSCLSCERCMLGYCTCHHDLYVRDINGNIDKHIEMLKR